MGKVYASWKDFPKEQWRWPNFSPQELASKREGELLVDEASLDKLQALREAMGKPLLITSAYRSAAHNKAVGGATNSQHRLGKAFDVMMTNQDPAAFERAARKAGFTGFGHYPKSGFMHIDTGPARHWNDGKDFPITAAAVATPAFQTEPKVETALGILGKPELLVGAGGVVSAGGALAQGNGPFQYALAAVVVIAAIAIVGFIAFKLLRRPADV